MALSFKGAQLPTEIILMGVRWYLAYLLSTRHVEELRLALSAPQIIYTLKFATEPGGVRAVGTSVRHPPRSTAPRFSPAPAARWSSR